jgi:hypothetical protein
LRSITHQRDFTFIAVNAGVSADMTFFGGGAGIAGLRISARELCESRAV